MQKQYKIRSEDVLEIVNNTNKNKEYYINKGKSCKNKKDVNFLEAETKKLIEQQTISEDGTLDMVALEELWFPSNIVSEKIFLSHSHRSEEDVFFIVGFFLEEFGLNCFIDSWGWGNIGALQSQLNDQYSLFIDKKDGRSLYDYKRTMFIANIVNIALVSALQKVMDKTPLVLFLQSIESVIEFSTSNFSLSSSWLYAEQMNMELLRIKPIEQYATERYRSNANLQGELPELKIKYKIKDNLETLSPDLLEECIKLKHNSSEILSVLLKN